ncbi:protein phosphatase 1 regulatory subunit 29-like [Lampetra fluviatilis]
MASSPPLHLLPLLLLLLLLLLAPPACRSDCWFLEGDREFVWQAICSQNQPPYESIPPHINSTVMDIKLNNNKIRSVQHASLRRFVNLTNLDLTHNAIESIEDGAFSSQRNLRVLRLSHNLVARLDEGLLRGLAGLESLYLQSNRIEAVTATALRPCPQLGILDVSDNRLAWLDEHVFDASPALRLLNLSGNPFHCGCTLLPFLRWLYFQQPLWEPRATCEPGLLPLLGGNDRQQRGAYEQLAQNCSADSQRRPTLPPLPATVPPVDDCGGGGGGGDGCGSAAGPEFTPAPEPRVHVQYTVEGALPRMSVQSVGPTSAVVDIHIPRVGSRMYMLVRGNGTASEVVKHLPLTDETVSLKDLQPGTTYVFCVAYVKGGRREHIKCAEVETRPRGWWDAAASSAVRHYAMTTLYCLAGMAFVLGAVYCCLRRRRRHEERQQQQRSKSATLKKTLADMRQGSQTEAGGASYQLLPTKSESGTPTRPPPVAAAGAPPEPDDAKAAAEVVGDAPRTAKGDYLEVRTGEGAGELAAESHDGGGGGCRRRGAEERRDSVAEIATIAKEVDKVNRIINNCIDALKSEAGATAPLGGPEPPAGPPAPSASRGAEERVVPGPPPTAAIAVSASSSSYGDPYGPAPQKSFLPEHSPRRPGPRPAGGRPHCDPAYGAPQGGGGEPRGPPCPRAWRPRAPTATATPTRGPCSSSSSSSRPRTPSTSSSSCSSSSSSCSSSSSRNCSSSSWRSGTARWGCAPRASCRECRSPRAPVMSALGCAVPVPPTVALPLQQQPQQHLQQQQLQQQQQQLQQYHHQQQQQQPQQQARSAYCQLSPRSQRSGYYSSPEYSAKSVQKIWVRFKPQQQQQQQQQQPQQQQQQQPQHKKVEEEHMAAGHALKMKVQLATDEDLHDILDFWKGVSAQQKP